MKSNKEIIKKIRNEYNIFFEYLNKYILEYNEERTKEARERINNHVKKQIIEDIMEREAIGISFNKYVKDTQKLLDQKDKEKEAIKNVILCEMNMRTSELVNTECLGELEILSEHVTRIQSEKALLHKILVQINK